MDGEAWWTTAHGAAKSRTELNDLTFTFTERGTGRKARGPQLEEMDCNCQTSFSSDDLGPGAVAVIRNKEQ